MAKDWAKSFYRSKSWLDCRDSYISKRMQIDGGLCEVCHKRQGVIVHHIEALTPKNITNPWVTLAHDNLSYECKVCHDQHEGHGIKNKSEWLAKFDADGNPYPLSEKE